MNDRELQLSKLLDEVICLWVFNRGGNFAKMAHLIPPEAYQEIAATRKLAEANGRAYPITGALLQYLKNNELL